MLYRLSYFRLWFLKNCFFKIKARKSDRAFSGRRWIRTTEGKNQQIYSLPHLATLVFSQNSFRTFEPMEGIEPTTPRLQITCSGQLSYIGNVVLFSRLRSYFLNGIAKVDIIFKSPKLFSLFLRFFSILQGLHPLFRLLTTCIPP